MIITDGTHTVKITIRMWNNGIGYGEDLSNDIFEDLPNNGINEDESDRVESNVYDVNDISYCIDYATDFMKSINTAGSAENMNVFVEDLSKKENGYLYVEETENKDYFRIYLIYNKNHDKIKLQKATQFINAYKVREDICDSDYKIKDYNVSCRLVPAQFANIFMNGYNDTAVKLFKRLGFEIVFKNPFEEGKL